MARTVLRRACTIPGLFVLAVAGAAVLIVAAVVTGPVCLCLRGRWRAVRLATFFLTYIAVEIEALAGALAVWIRCGPASRRDAARYQELNFRLIETALRRLYAAARVLFRLRIEPPEDPAVLRQAMQETSPRPVIVLSRHAGPGDSFLLIYGLLAFARRRPLIVLKRTLILDPWIDVILSRVPHCFVSPGGRGGSRAAEQIGELAAGMGDTDALVIFPEGGNFTPGRRRRAIGGLRRRGHRKRAAMARQLEHVLPPHPTGVLAALAAAPAADIAFVAHTGLDHLGSVTSVWRGIPLDDPLRTTWWRVPGRQVPAGPDARTDWLFAEWARIDTWISSHVDQPAAG